MRPLLLALLLAGCVGGPAPAPPPSGEAQVCPGPLCDPTLPVSNASVADAPDLAVGTSWTYANEMVYNPDPEFTLVLARADAAGYLFAGATEDDVAFHAAWGSAWFGERTRDLNRPDGGEWFRWPLSDGASWSPHEGFTLVATAMEVRVPGGTAPGFVVEGANDVTRVRYEYAPSVGQPSSWLFETRGRVMEKLELKSTGQASGWVWFERLPGVHAYDPAEPQALDVAPGADAMVLSVGGAGGGRATVVPPGGQPWTREYPGDASLYEGEWDLEVLPPSEGRWAAATFGSPRPPADLPAKAPLGWAYVVLQPLKWVRG